MVGPGSTTSTADNGTPILEQQKGKVMTLRQNLLVGAFVVSVSGIVGLGIGSRVASALATTQPKAQDPKDDERQSTCNGSLPGIPCSITCSKGCWAMIVD